MQSIQYTGQQVAAAKRFHTIELRACSCLLCASLNSLMARKRIEWEGGAGIQNANLAIKWNLGQLLLAIGC